MLLNYPTGFPQKIPQWKGKTLYQIVSSVQKNKNTGPIIETSQTMKPMPLLHYRKEIHLFDEPGTCNARTSIKITDLEGAGSSIVSETPISYSHALVNTLEIAQPSLSAENGACDSVDHCFSPEFNAKRRVRSSGMIPKKNNVNKNNDAYNTSAHQYLTSRNKTIKQNEFNYIRKGNAGLIPGPGIAAQNIYSPAGLSHCYQPEISAANNNNTFQYKLDDGSNIYDYEVVIPDGKYDPFSLNTAFQIIQMQQNNYLISPSGTKTFFLTISYDTETQSLTLIANQATQGDFVGYTKPAGALWDWNPTNTVVSYFRILDNAFSGLIGFLPGEYFNGINGSTFAGYILPNYVVLHYKPNNPSFGVQGAVDSSARLQRLRYNTITNGAALTKSAYGAATAAALAYGVSEQAYTAKTIVGDKPKLTPVINPLDGSLCAKRFIYR